MGLCRILGYDQRALDIGRIAPLGKQGHDFLLSRRKPACIGDRGACIRKDERAFGHLMAFDEPSGVVRGEHETSDDDRQNAADERKCRHERCSVIDAEKRGQAMQDRVISIVTQAQMDDMHEHGGTFGCGEYIHAGEPLTMLWDQRKEQQDAGNKAVHGPIDTIDELAKELGLDADALKSEINAYNGYCKEKKDLEFNKDPQYLFALDEGPYYAFELKVGIFSTVGGMKINNDCQVLDEKNIPIANLYAAGCDAGGLYGDAYNVSICEGSCQGFAVFTGKTAAEACAGKGEFATA